MFSMLLWIWPEDVVSPSCLRRLNLAREREEGLQPEGVGGDWPKPEQPATTTRDDGRYKDVSIR